jgi:single-stranded-DNA-specific exonuclease
VLADVDAEAHLARARMALRNAVAVVPHPGADGLAAGAIALRDRGERAAAAVLLDSDPFAPGAPLPDGPLAILDWGIRSLDRPALVVDHAMPEAAPRDDQVFVSGFGETPIVPTSVLLARIARDAPAWLAQIGVVAEVGADGVAPDARQLAALAGAPRRVPGGRVVTALELLTSHEHAAEALADPRVAELDEARRTWRSALEHVMRREPERRRDVAVVRFESPCVIEDLVARAWAHRLPGHQVIAVRNGTELAGAAEVAGRATRLPQERLAGLLAQIG